MTTPYTFILYFSSHRLHFALCRLSKAYGGRARDVLEIDRNEVKKTSTKGKLLPGMPYLDAEVSDEKKYIAMIRIIVISQLNRLNSVLRAKYM
jgi:hypothetical protein